MLGHESYEVVFYENYKNICGFYRYMKKFPQEMKNKNIFSN